VCFYIDNFDLKKKRIIEDKKREKKADRLLYLYFLDESCSTSAGSLAVIQRVRMRHGSTS
jgi:hypothetical protein